GLLVERDLMAPGQPDPAHAADAFECRRDDVRVDLVGPMAFQPHQHRLVGAVTATGQRERAVDLGTDAGGALEFAGLHQPLLHEAGGRAHRPHGVRGTRPDADLEQVEGADGHAAILGRCPAPDSCCTSATTATCATWPWRCWLPPVSRSSRACSSMATRSWRRDTGCASPCGAIVPPVGSSIGLLVSRNCGRSWPGDRLQEHPGAD